jgi:4-hydroxymandelate oxidase
MGGIGGSGGAPLPPLTTLSRHLAAAVDYEAVAPAHLDARAWAYLQGGAADEESVRDNIAAWRAIRLLPQVLDDLRGGHTRLRLFGDEYAHPLLVAPVAYQRLFHAHGEIATVQGAGAMDATMAVSAMTTTPLSAIAAQATAPLWFQLYWQGSRGASLELVHMAEAQGCRALLVTVDAPVAGARNREQRAGFVLPPELRAVHMHLPPPAPRDDPGAGSVFTTLMAQAPTWDDIAWLVGKTRLPVIIKGILHPRDARCAIDLGARGIAVSNHGGRTLDGTPAPAELLPALRQVVGPATAVLVDGGIRRGSDVFKALALGADAVMIGRPVMHALATAGALGVAHLLRILREELEMTMALCGCRDLAAIDAQHLFDPPA